jgi:hypothetical protein
MQKMTKRNMQERIKKKHVRFSILFFQTKYFIINWKCDALLIIYSSGAAGASAASTAGYIVCLKTKTKNKKRLFKEYCWLLNQSRSYNMDGIRIGWE